MSVFFVCRVCQFLVVFVSLGDSPPPILCGVLLVCLYHQKRGHPQKGRAADMSLSFNMTTVCAVGFALLGIGCTRKTLENRWAPSGAFSFDTPRKPGKGFQGERRAPETGAVLLDSSQPSVGLNSLRVWLSFDFQ